MANVKVQRTINARIEDVFDWLSTPTNWPLPNARLARAGTDGAFGLGAIREVMAGVGWFREEITAYERPHRYDYLILKSIPPLKHDGGSVRFREVAGGTEVTWTSTFTVPVPIVAERAAQLTVPFVALGFKYVLNAAERALAHKRVPNNE